MSPTNQTESINSAIDVELHIARAKQMRSEYIADCCSALLKKLSRALHVGHKSDKLVATH